MSTMLEWAAFKLFLFMLKYGMHRLVYHISSYIGRREWVALYRPFYGASWSIQAQLLKHGYHECPSCYWATKDSCEHLVRDGYCGEDWLNREA